MSMYLFEEYPIIANKTLAREKGLNEALILQQTNFLFLFLYFEGFLLRLFY